jgi:putative transcriptional regulator
MIVNHLSRLLGERRMSMSELQRRSGVSYVSLFRLYHGKATRYDGETLDKLCAALGVGVGELLEYAPGELRAEDARP